jgi:uncharacterized protein YlzI (FlbEa/FlbD family)
MPMIILTQERGDPVLINSDRIVHANRVSSSPNDVTTIAMGDNTTLTVRETLEQIIDLIQKGFAAPMNPIAANLNLKVKAGCRQQPLNKFHNKSGQDRNRNKWRRTIGSVVAACSLGADSLEQSDATRSFLKWP